MRYRVSSEIGRLRAVLVHRPGVEIARITPDNKDALLFDDLLWLERAQEEHDAFVAMMEGRGADALGHDGVRFVPTGGDAIGRLREQWDDGNNTLALEPGVVVACLRNQETNRRLRNADVEVLELDASELCRGRGGSRCMTQPLLRDPVG